MRYTKTVGNALRQVGKDLRGSVLRVDDERIIQAIVEANLDQCSVLWSIWHTAWRLHKARHIRWKAS